MSVRGFLDSMRYRGVCFFLQGGRLCWLAPSLLSLDEMAQARAIKAELVALLEYTELEARCAGTDLDDAKYLREERAAILEFEGNFHRAEAEMRAGLVSFLAAPSTNS